MNGQIFYGLHMVRGVAEYPEKEESHGEPYRVLISETTAKQMDATFPGKPMYVEHVNEVNVKDIKKESVGYVVESFFNKPDGNHWCKFIVTDQSGLIALQQGYVLSNCYIGQGFGPSGEWHAVPYAKEVTSAEYEHLAITQKPRYKESIVLTPEEFKKYNEDKEAELIRLSNSIAKTSNDNPKKQETKSMFNIFKKEKYDNADELAKMSVMLPKSKKEVTIERLVNSMDEMEMNSASPKMANGEDKVKVGDQEMTVNELSEKYNSMCKAKNSEEEEKKKNAMAEEEKAKNALAEEEKKKNAMTDEEKAKNAEEEEKKKNAVDEEEKKKADEKAQNSAHFERLSNAHAAVANAPVTDFSWDQTARGKSKYGSTKK